MSKEVTKKKKKNVFLKFFKKNISRIRAIKLKNVLYAFITLIVITIIGSLYLIADSKPGSFFYKIDMKIEDLISLTKLTPKAKLEYQFVRATERVTELKDVYKYEDKSREVLAEYNENIDNIMELLTQMKDSNDAEYPKITVEVIKTYLPAQARVLATRYNELIKERQETGAVFKEQRDVIMESINKTKDTQDLVFEMGLYNIKDSLEFSSYTMKKMYDLNREYQEKAEYQMNNFSLLKGQIKEEDLVEMQEWLNKAREIQREALNKITKLPGSEVYEMFRSQDEYYDKIDARLVELTQQELLKQKETQEREQVQE